MRARHILGLGCGAFVLFVVAHEAHAVRPRAKTVTTTHASGPSPAGSLDARFTHDFRSARSRDASVRRALEAQLGPVQVVFERADGRASRLVLVGRDPRGAVPGSQRDAALASRDAHARLQALAPLLSPGSRASDFRLVANHHDLELDMRDLAFVQRVDGLDVEGGQLSFRYAHDRLVAVVNDTITLRLPSGTRAAGAFVGSDEAERRALAQAKSGPGARQAWRSKIRGPLWWSQSRAAKHEARAVYAVELVAKAVPGALPQRRKIYIDARSGELVADVDMRMWGNAQVRYDVPQRYPAGGSFPYPLSYAEVSVLGETQVTGVDGQVSFPGDQATFTHALSGLYTEVVDDQVSFDPVGASLQDGQPSTVGTMGEELLEARLTTYIHTNIVKDRVRIIAPSFEFPTQLLEARVNIDDLCNAFWSGTAINFFVAGGGCENTGRLPDVVYHEFGHGAHQNAIVPGVGLLNVALSEGVSDYLSATITNDPGVARGFFEGSTEPLRQLDPVGSEWTWPQDTGEVHDEGRIIGGALWDLRTMLRDKYGTNAGTALTDRLWFAIIQRAYDIPSAYFETLLADDDDADLSNGTPNVCEISEAFGAHGLFRAPGETGRVDLQAEGNRLQVVVPLEIPFPQCGIEASATLRTRDRAAPNEVTTTSMQRVDGMWRAELERPPAGTVLQYAVDIDWSTGTTETLPHNLGDRWFEHYEGPVVPLYCTGFEGNDAQAWMPFPPFAIGAPQASTVAGDPQAPFEGMRIAGTDLDGEGKYSPAAEHRLLSPSIDVQGFAEVRLQYWRELDVEDAFFDQAFIRANGTQVWRNYGSPSEIIATVHHRDEQWRFHDVDLSDALEPGAALELEFGLQSDGGLEFGGWNLDALCVVGVEGPRCGDGELDPGEACDDGNLSEGDGCDASCAREPEPPVPPPSGEESGEGSGESGESGDEGDSGIAARGCGCATGPREDGGFGWAALGLFGLVLRRRRRGA